jgi:diguanylate cyclase (GGDEF)-like protein
MLLRSRSSAPRRTRGPEGPGRHQGIETAISPEQVARFSALLWAIGAAVGVLLIVLPHGRNVNVDGWAALAIFAAVVATWTLWVGSRQPLYAQYILSVLALGAVSVAVVCAHNSPVAFAVAGLYVLPTIYTASFYSSPVFALYLAVQAATSGVVLLDSGTGGAAAGWAVAMGTCTTVGAVVHLLQQALKMAATTDPLTGLVNRRALEPLIDRELTRCARLGHPLTLVIIDLDHFKIVNDEQGHQEGDRLLAEVSACWNDELRTNDVLARAGGDEFVLLLPSTGRDEAVEVLHRLSSSNTQQFSAGLAVASPGTTVDEVLRQADIACYRAKEAGRDQIVVDDRFAP